MHKVKETHSQKEQPESCRASSTSNHRSFWAAMRARVGSRARDRRQCCSHKSYVLLTVVAACVIMSRLWLILSSLAPEPQQRKESSSQWNLECGGPGAVDGISHAAPGPTMNQAPTPMMSAFQLQACADKLKIAPTAETFQ